MSRRGGNMGLSSDQVRQLQTALRDAGCDPGSVDGVMGSHTRRAIACARQKNNISGNNTNELLRSLNLNFTVQDSTGMGGTMRSGGRARSGSMTDRDSTMRGGSATSRDSTMRGRRGMRGDTSGAGARTRSRPDTTGGRRPRP